MVRIPRCGRGDLGSIPSEISSFYFFDCLLIQGSSLPFTPFYFLTVCSYAWLVLQEMAQAFWNHASGADSRARRARNAEAHARREPSSRAVFTEGSRVAWEDDASASSVVHWSSRCLKTNVISEARHVARRRNVRGKVKRLDFRAPWRRTHTRARRTTPTPHVLHRLR